MTPYKELADLMAAGSYTVRHCREIEAILRSLDVYASPDELDAAIDAAMAAGEKA